MFSCAGVIIGSPGRRTVIATGVNEFGHTYRIRGHISPVKSSHIHLQAFKLGHSENVSGHWRDLNTEQAQTRLRRGGPGTEWGVRTREIFFCLTQWYSRISSPSPSLYLSASLYFLTPKKNYFWNHFMTEQKRRSWRQKSSLWSHCCSSWTEALMNAASCHLLMELPCLGVDCCDSSLAVVKRLLQRLKDRIKHTAQSDRQPGSHIR